MHFKILFISSIFLFSCSPSSDQCRSFTEDETSAIDEMLSARFSYDNIKMEPAERYNRVIQYHAQDSWRQYNHIIRLYEVNHQFIIELKSNMYASAPEWPLQTIRRKIELTPIDGESLWSKAKSLYCKEVDLDPDFKIIDGEYCKLLIKEGDHRQGFTWQTMDSQIRYGDGRVPEHKDAVTELVGDLMRLCEFPNGKKYIDIDSFYTTKDSSAFKVILGYGYNVLDYNVYFDDKLLDKDIEGEARVRVPVSDTNNIRKRLRIKVTLLDKSEIEL